jgi:hypothetical protein
VIAWTAENEVFDSIFCEGATGKSVLDVITAGLPGPGVLIQPMSARWLP